MRHTTDCGRKRGGSVCFWKDCTCSCHTEGGTKVPERTVVSGMRYRVVYAMPGYDKMEMVGIYLGDSDPLDGRGLILTFGLEPVANNASLPKKWIHEVWETARAIQAPIHVRPETQVW